jgi:archaetidylinositol phosphate synthase
MVLERYRGGWETNLTPIAARMGRMGITPNMLTVVSFVFALLAAVAFAFATSERMWLLLAASAAVSINAILDGLDGKLARITNTETARGDYLDHVVDRYSDLAILTGVAMCALADLRWGLFAIVGTFLTSYMGTQAQALGLGRNYGGWLGRADRLVILISVPVLAYAADFLGFVPPVSLLTLMLAYFAIAGNVTALQRFWSGWKALGERDS